MIKKIISGGQTGADSGGLIAGKTLNILTGGHAPKGFLTEYGPNYNLKEDFNLIEDYSPKYPPRTKKNVLNSDGTIIFGKYEKSSKLTGDISKYGTTITKNFK